MSDFGGALKPIDEYPGCGIAILGVPFDEKSSYLRGAAGGPAAIRRASTGKCYNEYTELGVDLATETVLVDLGDVDTSGDMDKTFALTEKAVEGILGKGAVPVILGGDHSITYPVIKAFSGSTARSTSCISTPIRIYMKICTATGCPTPARSPGSSRTAWRRTWSRSASERGIPITGIWRRSTAFG